MSQQKVYRHKLSPQTSQGVSVQFLAVVQNVRKSKNIVFWDVTYPTGSSQVAAKSESFSDEEWAKVRSVKRGSRLICVGWVGETESGQKTIFLSEPPEEASQLMGTTLDSTRLDLRRVGTQILSAAVAHAAEKFFESQAFLRIQTSLLSASWRDQKGAMPLQVTYPGFGNPGYIAVTPAIQLLEALIATGENGVYTSSTCITTSYKQESEGVESAIIMARTVGLNESKLKDLAINLLLAVGAQMNIELIPHDLREQMVPVKEIETAEEQTTSSGCVFFSITPNVDRTKAFRLHLGKGIMPIELIVDRFEEGVAVGTVAFYPGRLMPTLEHSPIRRLGNLGALESKINV